MRVEQEKIPSALEVFDKIHTLGRAGVPKHLPKYIEEAMEKYLKLHLKAIRYEYNQYQFFLDGYRNGSASISECTAAHDRFLKLLE